MGLLSWAKKHPWEAAAIAATAGFGGAGLAGVGPLAGLLGGEAAAGGAAAGGGAASSLIPAAGAATDVLPFAAAMGESLPVSELATSLMPQTGASMFEAFGPEQIAQSFPGNSAMAEGGFKLNPKNALMLAGMLGGGQQQRPQQLGAPMDMGNPMQRPALVSQEDIMKRWLLRNDPNTYARLYGQPMPGVV